MLKETRYRLKKVIQDAISSADSLPEFQVDRNESRGRARGRKRGRKKKKGHEGTATSGISGLCKMAQEANANNPVFIAFQRRGNVRRVLMPPKKRTVSV